VTATLEAPEAPAVAFNVDDFPWFPAYSAKWLLSRSVRLMTFEQRGIFWELLCMAWRDQGIPADLEDLAALIGCPLDTLEKAWKRIGPQFAPKDGDPSTLVNPNQEAIRAEQMAKFARASAKGKAAVAAREAKRASTGSSTGDPQDDPAVNHREGEGEGEKKKEKKPSTSPSDAAKALYDGLTTDQRVKEVWDAIVDNFTMRKEKKFGQLAPTTLAARAKEYKGLPVVQLVAALNHATAQGYQGVFPEKFAPKGGPALKVVDQATVDANTQAAVEAAKRQLFG